MATKGITVYLVRHGQTWFNHFNKMQGWSDSPLTENGIKDGTNTGVILRIAVTLPGQPGQQT